MKRASSPDGARLAAVPGLAQRYPTEENWQKVETLEPFAWMLARPKVAGVIAGATSRRLLTFP